MLGAAILPQSTKQPGITDKLLLSDLIPEAWNPYSSTCMRMKAWYPHVAYSCTELNPEHINNCAVPLGFK